MAGELLVVSGPPGSGKSTVAALLADAFSPSALVPGDDFFGFLRQGYVDPWLPEAHAQNEVVTRVAAACAGRFVSGGYTVVYDGVVGPWLADEFAQACGLDRLHYALLMPPGAVVLERVGTRHGHGFTDLGAARGMYEDFRSADVDPRHVVDGAGDARRVADMILERMGAGSLVWG